MLLDLRSTLPQTLGLSGIYTGEIGSPRTVFWVNIPGVAGVTGSPSLVRYVSPGGVEGVVGSASVVLLTVLFASSVNTGAVGEPSLLARAHITGVGAVAGVRGVPFLSTLVGIQLGGGPVGGVGLPLFTPRYFLTQAGAVDDSSFGQPAVHAVAHVLLPAAQGAVGAPVLSSLAYIAAGGGPSGAVAPPLLTPLYTLHVQGVDNSALGSATLQTYAFIYAPSVVGEVEDPLVKTFTFITTGTGYGGAAGSPGVDTFAFIYPPGLEGAFGDPTLNAFAFILGVGGVSGTPGNAFVGNVSPYPLEATLSAVPRIQGMLTVLATEGALSPKAAAIGTLRARTAQTTVVPIPGPAGETYLLHVDSKIKLV